MKQQLDVNRKVGRPGLAWQVVLDVALVADELVPAWHSWHIAAPVVGEKLPAAHACTRGEAKGGLTCGLRRSTSTSLARDNAPACHTALETSNAVT